MSNPNNTDHERVVAHFRDGSLLKGFTHDFDPGKPFFHLTSEQEADKGKVYEVSIVKLKAVFFVKTLEGDKIYHEKKRFKEVDTSHLKGLRIQLQFEDGEIIRGTTLDYNAGKQGFFMCPVDPRSNNSLIYVVAAALEDIKLAGDVVDDPGPVTQTVWDGATRFID